MLPMASTDTQRRLPVWWSTADSVVAALYLVAVLAVGIGFLYPDPLIHNNEVDTHLATYGTRLGLYAGFPLLAVGFAALYVAWRSGGAARARGLRVTGGLLVAALVAYVPLSFLHERSLTPAAHIHPYLQLTPPAVPKPVRDTPDTRLVLCLGGSTTAWTDANGVGWTERVERQLNVGGAGPVRVINQGMEWYTTQHSLLNYELNLRPLKPDVVVIMHVVNDLMQSADHSYYAGGSTRADYGNHNGPLARLQRGKPLLAAAAAHASRLWYWNEREVIETDEFAGLPFYERNLRRLVELLRADGAHVVLMTQGSLYKEELTDAEREVLWMHTHNGVGATQRWSLETARKGMQRYNATCRGRLGRARRLAGRLGLRSATRPRALLRRLPLPQSGVRPHCGTAGPTAAGVARV